MRGAALAVVVVLASCGSPPRPSYPTVCEKVRARVETLEARFVSLDLPAIPEVREAQRRTRALRRAKTARETAQEAKLDAECTGEHFVRVKAVQDALAAFLDYYDAEVAR